MLIYLNNNRVNKIDQLFQDIMKNNQPTKSHSNVAFFRDRYGSAKVQDQHGKADL